MTNTAEMAMTEAEVRRDERAKWAKRIREDVSVFADFASDKRAAVLLVALAIEMPIGGDA